VVYSTARYGLVKDSDAIELNHHGNRYLYDVCDVGIRLSTARVMADITCGVKVHQRPLAVWNVVRRISVLSNLKKNTNSDDFRSRQFDFKVYFFLNFVLHIGTELRRIFG